MGKPHKGWPKYDAKVRHTSLSAYDELREAHKIIRKLYVQVSGQNERDGSLGAETVNAVETVHGVLYMAEEILVREHAKDQEVR